MTIATSSAEVHDANPDIKPDDAHRLGGHDDTRVVANAKALPENIRTQIVSPRTNDTLR